MRFTKNQLGMRGVRDYGLGPFEFRSRRRSRCFASFVVDDVMFRDFPDFNVVNLVLINGKW